MKTLVFTLLALAGLGSCSSVKEPEYRDIRDIRIVEIGLLESTAGIDIVYYNPNSFGMQVTEAEGTVYIDSSYLGRFTLEKEIEVAKRSDFIVPGLLKIDMVSVMSNGRDIINKKDALVRIEGNARVRKAGMGINVPIRYEGMQNIEKFRQLVYK